MNNIQCVSGYNSLLCLKMTFFIFWRHRQALLSYSWSLWWIFDQWIISKFISSFGCHTSLPCLKVVVLQPRNFKRTYAGLFLFGYYFSSSRLEEKVLTLEKMPLELQRNSSAIKGNQYSTTNSLNNSRFHFHRRSFVFQPNAAKDCFLPVSQSKNKKQKKEKKNLSPPHSHPLKEHLHDMGQITMSYLALALTYTRQSFAFSGSSVWKFLLPEIKMYKSVF